MSAAAGEDVVDARGVGDPGRGRRCYEAEHDLDVVPARFERQVPDALVLADAVAELVQPLDRVFHRGQGAVGGVGDDAREVGPEAGPVLTGKQEAPEAEAQLGDDFLRGRAWRPDSQRLIPPDVPRQRPALGKPQVTVGERSTLDVGWL